MDNSFYFLVLLRIASFLFVQIRSSRTGALSSYLTAVHSLQLERKEEVTQGNCPNENDDTLVYYPSIKLGRIPAAENVLPGPH
jgi:hypothetical protein